jgi:tetratricopeptide (TPR) repeat protein
LVQAYFDLGVVLDKSGKFNDAMDCLKKVIQIQPDNAEAYNYLGYSYADKGISLPEAEKDVLSALKLDPQNAYYLDSLGWVYYQQKRFTDAKTQFEKSIELLPEKKQKDDATVYDHLAQTEIQLGQKDDAVAQWKKAAELDPANKDIAAHLQKNQSATSAQ